MAGCAPRPKAVLEGWIRSQQKVDTADRLDRRTLLRVDGWVYAARRLVHVTPPVNAEAAPVVGAHEPQALHPWQGMDTDQNHSLGGAAHGHLQRCVSTAVHRSAHERSMPPASSPPMRCDAAATKALAHLCLCEAHSAT